MFWVFKDNNVNGKFDKGDESLRRILNNDHRGELTFRSLRNRVQFNPLGFVRGTMGSFVYCTVSRNDELARSLVISLTGRSRFGFDSNGDGIRETSVRNNIDCSV